MNKDDFTALAARMEKLAGLAAAGLEQQMADPEGDSRKARELAAILKDMLGLARELRGDEGRDVVVRFLGDTDAGSV